MDQQTYIALADQVARQTPELAALDADIASQQQNVDALQAAVDAAQVALDAADDEGKAAAQDALKAAQDALAAPASTLAALKVRADAIRSAIAQCESEMQGSGLSLDGDAIAASKLADAKAAMWERIKAERDRRSEQGGYTTGGKWFHSDVKSRTQQLGLVLLGASIPANTLWKTMDGTFVTMTPTLAGQIFGAAAAQDMATFGKAEAHKAAMEASDNPLAYDFSGNWPAIFEG